MNKDYNIGGFCVENGKSVRWGLPIALDKRFADVDDTLFVEKNNTRQLIEVAVKGSGSIGILTGITSSIHIGSMAVIGPYWEFWSYTKEAHGRILKIDDPSVTLTVKLYTKEVEEV